METSNTLVFFVNGKKIVDNEAQPEWTLLYYLRTKLRLCGTKLACAEGGCGACTVMVSRYDRTNDNIYHFPVNACLAPICSMHGLAVTTVEGIGSTKTRLHPVQERIAKSHGSQCGFCTPGIVMSMYTLLRSMEKPSMKDMEIAFQGNLCRCTGYRPIIEGFKTFTEEWELQRVGTTNGNSCGMGDKCCKNQNGLKSEEEVLFKPSEFTPLDRSQEPIFPPELKVSNVYDNQELVIKGKANVTWYRPVSLQNLVDLKSKYPEAKIIVGNSEVGVEVKFKNAQYPVLIAPTQVKELTEIKVSEFGVTFGAAVTLIDVEKALQKQINEQPTYKSRIFVSVVKMIHWFAGKQIRSVASIGGNIMTGSPISDLNPIFIAANVELHLASKLTSSRKVSMDENFFTGYRKNILKSDEILQSITIPYTKENEYFVAYKQARRRDDDIAIVNVAVRVVLKENTRILDDLVAVFGGMAPTTIMALKTRKNLKGKEWNEHILELAYLNLIDDLPLQENAPGGMISYRRSLTLSLFFRTFMEISNEMQLPIENIDLSGIHQFEGELPKSSQYFEVYPDRKCEATFDKVGQPVIHQSANKQATGEAIYCDDMPKFENELYMGLVCSTKAHANIISIDTSDALSLDGVHGILTAKDIDINQLGPVVYDEEILISKTVTSQGQLIAIVLAEDQLIAQKAAKKVKVEYEELQPVIISIEDAIKHNSYFAPSPLCQQSGDVDQAFKEADLIVEGECRTGCQEQFYFETQCVIAVPKKEDYEMEIHSSTQYPAEVSSIVARVLQIPQNRVITKVKRLGGGFGGKESKSTIIAVPAAIAAMRFNRPVRIMLDRDEDMHMTGGRHPFLMKYKVAVNKDGKILGVEAVMYSNAGYSYDVSIGVMERAIFHFNNSYNIINCRLKGYTCKTNILSNTAFRGFGAPQGMFMAETMIRHIAHKLNKDVVQVSHLNLYREGDITFYAQKMLHCTIERCWNECLESSDYYKRLQEVQTFNKQNRWKKRGLSITPTTYGVAFTQCYMNQAGALMLVYRDGSVLLTHSGTEMGQGLHTKMLQIASRVLEIPMEKIHISETATDKVPNTSPTAASCSSDLNGMAVIEACQTIITRLEPIKKANPNGTWEQWVSKAYFERINLSATGFYKTPDLDYDWDTNSGTAFNYYTYGVGCTEVEVDCLTGDHQVLRTDIVMDLGESLNPAIDIGQIEGAFMQGYGLFVLEEMMISPNGTLLSRGPGMYKLPGFGDIPIEFNVSLLKGASNPRAVYSSKAVGEPPLFLASSVLFAIQEAVTAARKDEGITEYFVLNAPATSARIRLACQDKITSMIEKTADKSKSGMAWNIIP